MSIYADDFTSTFIILEGQKYKVSKIKTIDVSEQEGKEKGTIQITHKIEGFDVPIYLVIDQEGNSFTFGMYLHVEKVIPLFVPVNDQFVFEKATEIVSYLEN
ncbi:hypothetical protein ACT7CW_06640 [Bacillus pacificus]|nr:hypothetical protein [Bacillus cereus]